AGSGGTIATGINAAGQVVGLYRDGKGIEHGFLYSEGSYAALNDPSPGGSSSTYLRAINDAGQVTGEYADINGHYHGVAATVSFSAPVTAIIGTPEEGQLLTATATAGQGDSLSFAWFSSADGYTSPIGTASTYLVTEADEGNRLEVVATADDNGITTSGTSA